MTQDQKHLFSVEQPSSLRENILDSLREEILAEEGNLLVGLNNHTPFELEKSAPKQQKNGINKPNVFEVKDERKRRKG